MSSDLDNCIVADIAASVKNALVGGPFGSNLVSKDYVKSGVPVIRGQNMGHGRWVRGEFAFVSPQKANDLSANAARPGDLVFTQRGTLGQVAIIPAGPYEKYIVSQSQMKLTVDPKRADTNFLYYLFCSPKQQAYIQTHAIRVGVPHTNLGILRDTPVSLPPIEDQIKIATILGKIDDKIELNRQINQTLEEIAQTIFKSWFVDFEPVKAKIEAKENGQDPERAAMCAISGKTNDELDRLAPEQLAELAETAALFPDELVESELGVIPSGWEVVPFSDIANLDTTSVKPQKNEDKLWEHYSIPAFDVSESPSFEKGLEIKSNKYRVRSTSVLVSKLNPHFPRIWLPAVHDEEAAICSTEFMQFVPIISEQRVYIYELILSHSFQQGILQRVTGTTGSRQRAQPKSVATMQVIKPTDDLITCFVSKAEDLLARKSNNIKESQSLAELRDTLLPKLLSGEIGLSQINNGE